MIIAGPTINNTAIVRQKVFGMGRENGVWVELYSTAVIFLTDAFTCEFPWVKLPVTLSTKSPNWNL